MTALGTTGVPVFAGRSSYRVVGRLARAGIFAVVAFTTGIAVVAGTAVGEQDARDWYNGSSVNAPAPEPTPIYPEVPTIDAPAPVAVPAPVEVVPQKPPLAQRPDPIEQILEARPTVRALPVRHPRPLSQRLAAERSSVPDRSGASDRWTASPGVGGSRAVPRAAPAGAPPVTVGAAVLANRGFAELRGRRIGLITNAAATINGQRTLDVFLAAPDITVAAVLTPEHGLFVDVSAGRAVGDQRLGAGGIPVHSLYGKTRKPTPAMLRGLDALVFDIQDVGTRAFTYISTLALAMQAAAQAGIEVWVLDRPNPLGGLLVEGFTLEPGARSFVGMYDTPLVHGMTVGELARMAVGEGLVPDLGGQMPRVVWMEGWRRDMLWPDTGLAWVPPSPNLPTFEAALVYPGTVLLEATVASEGRGTAAPFVQFGVPWRGAGALADRLTQAAAPRGAVIRPVRYRPRSLRGRAENPKFRGQTVLGARVEITDPRAFRPAAFGVHVLSALNGLARAQGTRLINKRKFMRLLAGTDRLAQAIGAGTPAERIIRAWEGDVARFRALRARWLNYPDGSQGRSAGVSE